MKRGKLSKEEKKYITENVGTPVKDIAEYLGRSVDQVEKFVVSIKKTVTEDGALTNVLVPKGQFSKTIARHYANGVPLATVLTEAASQAADDFGRSIKKNRMLGPDVIHRPKGNN